MHLAAHIANSRLVLLKGGVKHYQFIDSCTPIGRESFPLLCTDRPGTDRDSIHEKTAELAVQFFDARLGAARR
jgi:hypothetical protein